MDIMKVINKHWKVLVFSIILIIFALSIRYIFGQSFFSDLGVIISILSFFWPIISELSGGKKENNITASNPREPKFFCGREDVINEILSVLESKSCVLLSAMDGMGKTELCSHLFHRAIGKKGLPKIKAAGWLEFKGNIAETFYNQIYDITKTFHLETTGVKEPMKREIYLARAKQYTREHGKSLLLFIDDFDKAGANSFKKEIEHILGLGCKVVLTSRISEIEGIESIKLAPLDNENCRKLYKYHSKDSTTGDDILNEIIKLAGNHALTIELLGEAQRASLELSAEKLLQRLKEEKFDISKIKEEFEHSYDDGTLIEHLSKVLDIAKIDKEPEQMRILRLFSLFPSLKISADNAKKWLELKNIKELNKLSNKNWLQKVNGSHYLIPSVLASVIRARYKLTCKEYIPLITSLTNELDHEEKEASVIQSMLLYAVSAVHYLRDENENIEYAVLAERISNIYYFNGYYAIALYYIEKVMRIKENVLGSEHTDTANTYNYIASVYSILGDYDKALLLFNKVLKIQEKAIGAEHPDTASTCCNIANVYGSLGCYDKALLLYSNALKIQEKAIGAEHLDTANTYYNIALVYNILGNYDKAFELFSKALKIREKALGAEHPETAMAHFYIATVYYGLRNYDKALKLFNKTLNIQEKILGEKHPNTAITYNAIASVYRNQGIFDKALDLYSKALNIHENLLGAEHPNTANTYYSIALVYHNQKKYYKALELYGKALKIQEKVLGAEHPDIASTCINIANVYSEQGEYEKAFELYGRALNINEKALGAEHPDTALAYFNIAHAYYDQRDYALALELFSKALNIQEKALGKGHPNTEMTYLGVKLTKKALEALKVQDQEIIEEPDAATFINMGSKHENQAAYESALECYIKALNVQEKAKSENHPDIATTHKNIARVYYNLREYEKALEYYGKALNIQEKELGEDHPDTLATYNNIASIYSKQGAREKEFEYYGMILNVLEKSAGNPDAADIYSKIAQAYYAEGDHKSALEYYGKALEVLLEGGASDDTAGAYSNIAFVYKAQGEYEKASEYRNKAMEIMKKN